MIRGPLILGVRAGSLVTLYQWRLRRRLAQELLAVGGIAIGVALVFGVLLANTSITGSAGRLVHQLIGSARFQLAARSAEGFDQHVAEAAGRLPGVQVAAPILREDATIVGSRGRQAVQLVGVTPRLVALGSEATQNLGAGTLLISGGVGLPSGVASTIGARLTQSVTLLANGEAHSLKVRAVLGSQTIGAVAGSPVVISLLSVAQLLVDKHARVTNVLIKPRPGADRLVARELLGLAAGRMDVEPADNELRLLSRAAQPNAQSTTLFAAISAMIGFLLALNAMLLTVPDRRRFIAELRTQGFAPSQVILVLGFQALALGVIGSLAGIALGEVLAHTLFGQVPDYLAAAFPISSEQIITAATIVVPVACGVLAALLASLPPLFDLRSDRALDAVLYETGEAGQRIRRPVMLALGLTAVLLIVAVTVIALVAPSLTVLGGAILALAAICLIPCVFAAVISLLALAGERIKGSMLSVAVIELHATTTRSIALAAVAALAVYGSVAIGGARHDLTHGLETAIAEYESTADIWVTTGQNVFNTDSFSARAAPAAIARVPGVASVRIYQGSLLDIGARRMLIRARDPSDSAMIQPSQLLHGNLAHATQLIRQGGWASISDSFASEHHLRVGGSFILSTPSGGVPLRVAAITTNLGWPPGAIAISTTDYRRGWQTTDPSALEVNLKPGVPLTEGKRAVQAALGAYPGLLTQTFREREAQTDGNARQGLKSLGDISTLLLVAGALALAASLSAVIWQRRDRLASMKTQGFDHWQLWRSLLVESAIVLTIGYLDGAMLGVYGHALADRWLRLTTGFPAPFTTGWLQVFLILVFLASIALTVVALPGYSAARAPARAGFQE